jgi:NadR type nicotinamide-nucleotide adenylyltransferase
VVLGPESTGKSTLSAALAACLHTLWVPEYARDWLENLGRPYTEPDLLSIARGQLASEELLAARAPGLLICDTDLYVIKVWSEHRYGRCDPWILEQIATRHYDLYLLTGIDMPWQPDPLREHPDEAMRVYFYRQYLDIVQQSGRPWVCLNGPHEQRLQLALEAARALLPDI